MAGLRPTETDRMVAVLREINRADNLTIVMIEHVMRAVAGARNRVHVLHHGASIWKERLRKSRAIRSDEIPISA